MFDSAIYKNRRQALRNKVQNGLILILGNNEAPANYPDNTYKFRQDSSFLYFFGHSHPGYAGIMDVEAGEDYFFGNDVDMDDIIWMGPQPSVKDLAAQVGVQQSYPFAQLKEMVGKAVAQGRKIHFLPPYRYDNMMLLEELTGIRASIVKKYASLELIKAVVALRSVKEACEIEEIDLACNIGYEMHTAAMRLCKPGVKEQYIAGVLDGIASSYGSMTSFATILTQHGETLHNHDHSHILEVGRMMLTDAGAERLSNYCSDHTRTVPVGGKFEGRQKDVYNIVLACHDRALEIARPGITYMSVHQEVCKVLAQGLKDLGLMKGNIDEAVAAGAHALFLPHGLGHMMGLDVHDMEDLGQIYVGYDDEVRPSSQFGLASLRMGRRLQEGFVITDEPGCYFIPALIDKWRAEKMHTDFLNYDAIDKFKDFGGIRNEEDYLITETGARRLGKKIPLTPEEVEATQSRRYAGNQIQPQKTVAVLKGRRWVADYEDGLQKIYYKENIIATIYAMADWFSPADIEAPTLEYVCFHNRKDYKLMKISEIPPVIFSEVMRDVDLAVSIAHAGSVDPETSHSTIEMRSMLVELTMPLFHFKNVTIKGSFAHIEGKLGKYNIHLGSGVIHQEGGAQIAVLPVHSQNRGRLFLPFVDEDPKTAEILTKIIFFAEDDKIKDPSILNQIKKKRDGREFNHRHRK